MKSLSYLLFLICFTAISSLAFAGGVVPDGMGSWDNGTRDPIPMSSALLKWTYDTTFTDYQKDWIMWSFAIVDKQTVDFRLLYGPVSSGSQSQIHIDWVNTAVPSGCFTPGQGCLLGNTTCGSWGENAGPKYRTCNLYRIAINPVSLEAYASTRNLELEGVWVAVLNHEIGHAIGLPHSNGIMSAGVPLPGKDGVTGIVPFSQCQLATLRDFDVNDSPDWVYDEVPNECLPPPATSIGGAMASPIRTTVKTKSLCEVVAY